MGALRQRVRIPADHRLHLDVDVPEEVPEGDAEVVIRFAPAETPAGSRAWRTLAGCLRNAPGLRGDPVRRQRKWRDEWD